MHTPLKQTGKAPLDLFSQVASTSAPKHFHPFGCPVYVLSEPMQANAKGPKWEERARVGIYLGNSPLHARSISLILNIETGLASPQFHIKFDDLFETVPSTKLNIQWQKRTRFVHSTESDPIEPPKPDTYYLPPSAFKPSEQQEAPVPATQPQSQSTSSATTEQPSTASEGATLATQTTRR